MPARGTVLRCVTSRSLVVQILTHGRPALTTQLHGCIAQIQRYRPQAIPLAGNEPARAAANWSRLIERHGATYMSSRHAAPSRPRGMLA